MSSTLSSHPTLTPNLNNSLGKSSIPTPSMELARSLNLNYDCLLAISPLDLFYEQLNTSNAETRVDAMRRLFVVANAIGRDLTLKKLIPHLANHIVNMSGGEDTRVDNSEEDDEILLILADQLGQIVLSGLIPGYRATCVLPILERLAGVEETVVRNRAVESINAIIPLLIPHNSMVYKETSGEVYEKKNKNKNEDDNIIQESFVKVAPTLVFSSVKRLSRGDWFTTRVSACGVIPIVYKFLIDFERIIDSNHKVNYSVNFKDLKGELRSLYHELCEDDTPMVRRSAGKYLGRLFEAIAELEPRLKSKDNTVAQELVRFGSKNCYEDSSMGRTKNNMYAVSETGKEIVVSEMVKLYCNLANDEQDSVRLLAVGNSGSVGCALGRDANLCKSIVLPIIKSGTRDLSWRVRHNLAKNFAIVAYSQGFPESLDTSHLNEIFICFESLIKDVEGEVRACAVENIAHMTQLGGADQFRMHISPTLQLLADDPVLEVRSKLAESIMDCCDEAICSVLNDNIILQDFKPLLDGFLSDEFAEVQLHILGNLNRMSHLFSKMDTVVNNVLTMTTVLNWRLREAVARLLPHLAEARGVIFFEEKLYESWTKLLLDQVADVRLACVTGNSKLLSVAGATWIQRQIIPHYVRIYDESVSYLIRITILRSYAALAIGENSNLTPVLLNEIVSQLLRGLVDIVANVRIVAMKGLASISAVCEEPILDAKVRPALNIRVMEDDDDDCKHFAQVALNTCSHFRR